MTIGRNSEAPAAYALTSTIKRLLDHLSEANLYSGKDLASMNKTLDMLEGIVSKAGHNNSPYLSELLGKRVELCKSRIAELQSRLDRLGEPLPHIHEKLISILRSMSLANTKAKVCPVPRCSTCSVLTVNQFSTSEVEKLQAQIKEIDEMRKDGKFVSEDGSAVPGSDEVSELLGRCLLWSQIVLDR